MGNSVNSNSTSTTVTVLSDSSSSSSSLKKSINTSQKSLRKEDEGNKSANKLVDILTRKPSAKPAFFIKVNSISSNNSTQTSRTLSTSSTSNRPTSSLLTTSSTARTTTSIQTVTSTTSSLDNLPTQPKRGLSMPRLGSIRYNPNKVYPQSTSSLISTFTASTVGSVPMTIKSAVEDRTYTSNFNDETDNDLTFMHQEDDNSENCNSDPDCVSSTSSIYSIQPEEIPILCITNPDDKDVTSNFYQRTEPKLDMRLNDVDDEI